MSTHIIGFRPPDEKWEKMKRIWEACQAAGVDAPKEVNTFFNYQQPESAGVEVDIENTSAVTEFRADMQDGYEVDVSKLPPDVKIIRVFNSY